MTSATSPKKIAVYCCTSSKTNLKGDSQARQKRASLKALQWKLGRKPAVQVVNECISGMLPLPQRKKLQSLLDGAYDAVYVESVRSLARKASAIEEIYEKAKKTGTKIVVADLPNAFDAEAGPAVNFQCWVMAAVQEFEWDVIVRRLQEGLKAKAFSLKQQGHKEPLKVNGRPSYLEQHMNKIDVKVKVRLQKLCQAQQHGRIGLGQLALEASKVLRLRKPMGKDAAVTLSIKLGVSGKQPRRRTQAQSNKWVITESRVNCQRMFL
jgi:DNA invertase Pin-like site-specific DNA recombinase